MVASATSARFLVAAVLLGALPAQVGLQELAALARARADRQRPEQEKALQPFWVDLSLDYRGNSQYLDQRIGQVAGLGDGVVPLLLEKLTPTEAGAAGRHLAGNCRRVLEKLDPASFLDALIELANSGNEVAREEALRLLGRAAGPRATQALLDRLALSRGEEQLLVLSALRTQANPQAAPSLVPLLGSDERRVREAVLDHLVASKATAVVQPVLQAFGIEKEARLLPLYVQFFAAAAAGNAEVATALLPLLDRDRLDSQDTQKLVQALAQIAPKGHDGTMGRMHDILDQEDPGSLGLQAALTLQALGDRKGLEKLHKTLSDLIRNRSRKRDLGLLHLQRGDLYVAAEQWDKAKADFEDVLRNTQSTAIMRRALLQTARCEAHRRRFKEVLELLQQSQAGYDELVELARTDAAMQEALQQEKIRTWLQGLKDGGGK